VFFDNQQTNGGALMKILMGLVLVVMCLSFAGLGCDKSEMNKQSQKKLQLNDPNKMTYLYVILADGNWLKVTIIGKLTSTTKRLTRSEAYQCDGNVCKFVPAPDEMGVWGESTPAKVGMTTLGSLLEIGGFLAYVYSETPLTFSSMGQPVKMIEMNVEMSAEERQVFQKRLGDLKNMAEEAR